MSLATFIDECGEINVVIFPRVYSEVSKIMYVNKYYLLEGKIEVKETISLIANNLDEVIAEFDKMIGLNRLKTIHLNDSKNTIGAHKDRHECIGIGSLGIDTIKSIINHEKLRNLPFYLETPEKDLNGYAEEISLLKGLYEN